MELQEWGTLQHAMVSGPYHLVPIIASQVKFKTFNIEGRSLLSKFLGDLQSSFCSVPQVSTSMTTKTKNALCVTKTCISLSATRPSTVPMPGN